MKNEIERKLYNTLINMKRRCYNPTSKDYKNYGGRDITVCAKWLDKKNGFINFYNWAMTNGYQKDLTIDRINNDKGYSPDNCRWTDRKTQAKNRRQGGVKNKGRMPPNTIYEEIEGEKYSLSKLAEINGLHVSTIQRRYKAGKRGLELIKPRTPGYPRRIFL